MPDERQLVSTLIPVFNRAAMLREAVASVLAQTYRPIEIVIVDDGSTDDTPRVVDELARAHGEIRVLHTANGGPGAAREAARQVATAHAFSISTAMIFSNRGNSRRQVAGLIAHPECGASHGWTRMRFRDGSIAPAPWKRTGETIETMFPAMLQCRWWETTTPLYRASLLFPWLPLPMEEDWEFDAHVASRGVHLHHIAGCVSEMRGHAAVDGELRGRSVMAKISVVMSVWNGAAHLAATLDSIFTQSESDFELIVVDDGSTDDTPDILRRRAAKESRIRVITQENRGLTRALIRGCAAATAPVIARHDSGDTSMPERFRRQIDALRDDVVLVSCRTRVTAPEGEVLFESAAGGDEVRASLLGSPAGTIRGLPHHGTAMFRRDVYESAGGYREEFRYAQDVDLWIRMAQRGRIAILDEVLYEATYDAAAISASRRREQIELAKISIALRDGGDAALLLERARGIGAQSRPRTSRDEARALYFIASCLKRNGDVRYERYARDALRRDPLHARAWLLLLR